VAVDADTRLLRTFACAAEELNFTRAAARLHLTQQALSAHVRQLEARVGARLFDRTTRRVALTPAGAALLPQARAALAAFDDGVAAAQEADRRSGGVLGLTLLPMAVNELTGRIMRRFTEARPDIRLAVANAPLREMARIFTDGRTDVAFVRPPFRSEGLSMVTVLTEPRVAALPADHPLAGEAEIAPEAFALEPQVHVEGSDDVQAAFWTLAEHRGGRPMRVGAHMTTFDDFFGVVGAGLAVGSCPASAAAALGPSFPSVRFVPIRDIAPCTVAVAWRTTAETPAVRAFVAVALEVAAEDAGVHNQVP
jgi:DNA-binding transcriptional LysR family regulator